MNLSKLTLITCIICGLIPLFILWLGLNMRINLIFGRFSVFPHFLVLWYKNYRTRFISFDINLYSDVIIVCLYSIIHALIITDILNIITFIPTNFFYLVTYLDMFILGWVIEMLVEYVDEFIFFVLYNLTYISILL